MVEHMNHRIGQTVGNYRLLRLLGQGGFADVYLGEHIYLKTQAAIKVLRVHLSGSVMEDFLKEARTIARLDHPHIIHVFECGIADGAPFLVMNYAPNGSLRQRHPRGSRLSVEQTLSYVQQIASALHYAHQQKLIHRDIKPENMLIGQQNQLLLSDFGLVLVAHSSSSQSTQEMAGTIPYMAPEQLQGKARIASDQYALAVVVYEWLSGERPFNGTFIEIASQHMLVPPPSLCEKVPTLSPEVERVVFKALEKNPARRFESVQDFAKALKSACKSASPVDTLLSTASLSSTMAFPQRQTQPRLVIKSTSDLADHSGVVATAFESQPLADVNMLAQVSSQPTSPIMVPSAVVSMSTIMPSLHDVSYVSTQSTQDVVSERQLPHGRRIQRFVVLCGMIATLIAGSAGLLLSRGISSHSEINQQTPTSAGGTSPVAITTTPGSDTEGSGTVPDSGSKLSTPGTAGPETATVTRSEPVPSTPRATVETTPTAEASPAIKPTPTPTPIPPTPTPIPPTPTPVPPTPTPTPVPQSTPSITPTPSPPA